MATVGIIGGSGLDDPDIVQNIRETRVETPYGWPSSPVTQGTVGGVEVLLISRHGKNHELSPAEVNYRANIHALKQSGATCIIATTACGSLRQEIQRGDLVILDQFIDFTRKRINTFHDSFSNGVVHVSPADPFDKTLSALLFTAAKKLNFPVHPSGTVVTIEGPRFSTRAESRMFRLWGGDVINMSIAPEAALACEAGIPYATVAMSTDYDCWKDDEDPVSWDEILAVFKSNAEKVKQLLITVISAMKA
ncbi:MAG: S-methyl-5'-thioadenosine phosphorylase [Pseudomonadota bacterium]